MNEDRRLWNARHKELRVALGDPEKQAHAIDLFLVQHAMVHAGDVPGSQGPTFEDGIWEGIDETASRCIPTGFEHSIAWCFWHLTRIEDVTMNMLLANKSQLLFDEGWFARLQVTFQDTGNGMSPVDVARLGTEINIQALRQYRQAVAVRTREIVSGIAHNELQRKVDPRRLERVCAEGAVSDAGRGVLDYWGGLTGAGLLLMPPTRHCLIHLNEMAKIKKKCR